jgi:hypothetical protein
MRLFVAATIATILSSPIGAGGQAKLFRVHNGDDFVPGVEVAAGANIPGKNAKAVGILFVPDNVRRIRAVIVFVERAPRSAMSAQGRFGDMGWRRMSASCECALLFFRLDTVRAIDVNTPLDATVLRNAAVGGGDVLLLLMQRLASESQHPELAKAPFVFWGWSASAGFGTTFAERFPDRTLAVIRFRTHLRDHAPDLNTLVRTPMLLVASIKDETAGTENAETLWRAGSERGAPWTLVIEPEAAHFDEKALLFTQQVMFPWVAAIVAQRLSPNDETLRRVTDDGGWLGSRGTGQIASRASFTGNKADSTWIPDEPTAREWQNVTKRAQ